MNTNELIADGIAAIARAKTLHILQNEWEGYDGTVTYDLDSDVVDGKLVKIRLSIDNLGVIEANNAREKT